MTADRVLRAEEKLAYQEHTLETLNDTVYAQQRRIEQLEATVQRLSQRLEALADEWRTAANPQNPEPPPHY